MRRSVLVLSSLMTAVLTWTCSPSLEPLGRGAASVSLSALTLPSAITEVRIDAEPAHVSKALSYDAAKGTFSGTLPLPVGEQQLTARAFAGSQLAGEGTATVRIVAGQLSRVVLRILDASEPAPMGDASPGILTLVASTALPLPGQPVALRVWAVDPNGDPITYAWSSSCAGSSFTSTDTAETNWTASDVGPCTLTVTATANGKRAVEHIDLQVIGPDAGAASISGTFVPAPQVYMADAWADDFDCRMRPEPTDTLCPRSLAPGRVATVNVWFSSGAAGEADAGTSAVATASLQDDCGGHVLSMSSSGEWAQATWSAPSGPAMCVLTITIAQETMRTRYAFAILVR